MEFGGLHVNDMFRDPITKLDHTLIPPGHRGDVRSVRLMQECLSKIIDQLGEESSRAQGLNKIITSADRFRKSEDQILYLLKDASAQGGKGELTGLLKVGWKHLFLLDEQGQTVEVDCLCVLDFFIVPERQRHGNGKILFDHMLQDLQASPKALAIDGPSPKMEEFMRKNYGVKRFIKQSNNFAIAPEFFTTDTSKSGRSTPVTSVPPVGRFTAPKRSSSIGSIIHGGGDAVEKDRTTVTKIPENPTVEATNAELSESEAIANDATKSSERPNTLPLETVSEMPSDLPTSAQGVIETPTGRDTQLTERGYFDIKFYHSKLW